MVSALLSRCLVLSLGTLYPAYRSYKAIKNKDVREYVKWMMYWIVFALFTTVETLLDILMSWFPFYYEIKILFILWVLSPATRGSSLLYKKVVHPLLCSREKEIDDFIEKTKQQGYSTFLSLFQSGFQYASKVFIHSAIKGQWLLETQLKKSFSMNDVRGERNDMADNVNENQKTNTDSMAVIRKPTQIIYEEDNDLEEELDHRIDDDQRYLIAKQRTTKTSSKRMVNDDHNRQQNDDNNAENIEMMKRRHSSRRNNSSNYKSSEASHFGTLSRSKKVTKQKTKASSDSNPNDEN